MSCRLDSNKWLLITILVTGLMAFSGSVPCSAAEWKDTIQVRNPKILGFSSLPAQRISIGEPGDYKPYMVLLPNRELLIVAFQPYQLEAFGKQIYHENSVLYRSADGGVMWTQEGGAARLGRECTMTAFHDGVVWMECCIVKGDVYNKYGYQYSMLHRSVDDGHTWTTTRVTRDGFLPRAETMVSRNVLHLPDGDLLIGVDANVNHGGPVYVWRSSDLGRTWQRYPCNTGTFKTRSYYSFFEDGFLWMTKSGRILNIARVDSHEYPIDHHPVKPPQFEGAIDNTDHMVLFGSSDLGRSWQWIGNFGDYGQQYPSVLRLKDGRLLLTYTQRELDVPVGVRALVGVETPNGFKFDFHHDVLMLDTKTPPDKRSGGGFGDTVQLRNGILVTCYSYMTNQNFTQIEVLRWKLPPPKHQSADSSRSTP